MANINDDGYQRPLTTRTTTTTTAAAAAAAAGAGAGAVAVASAAADAEFVSEALCLLSALDGACDAYDGGWCCNGDGPDWCSA